MTDVTAKYAAMRFTGISIFSNRLHLSVPLAPWPQVTTMTAGNNAIIPIKTTDEN